VSEAVESARKAVRVLSVIVAAIFLAMALTGLARSQPTAYSIHKWSGHALVIAVCSFVPFSAGVGLQRNIRRRPGFAIAQTIVLLSLLALVLLASFTGYLGPSHVEDVSESTRNRFTILHLFALPSLIAILLTAWYWLFRPPTLRAAEQTNAADVQNGSAQVS
jgi:cytochrome bd-type quinol oxidase subunit 2